MLVNVKRQCGCGYVLVVRWVECEGGNGYAIIAKSQCDSSVKHVRNGILGFFSLVAFAAQFIIFAQLIPLAGFAFIIISCSLCDARTCSHRRVAQKAIEHIRNGTT